MTSSATAPDAPLVRPEYERTLEPFVAQPLERALPWQARLLQHTWLRKSLILLVLAVLWETVAQLQHNDLMLPTFLATARALFDGLASGELAAKAAISLSLLLQG